MKDVYFNNNQTEVATNRGSLEVVSVAIVVLVAVVVG